MDRKEVIISAKNISKNFRVYFDKGSSMKEKILFSNRRKYQNRTVLNDISFEVRRGEAVGLIGENGCGKSTTLKLLSRIMFPDRGTITIDGRVSALIELGAGFHPDMSGRENIYINAAIFGLNKGEIDARLQSIIDFSELEEYIDNPVRTYSSGMYMRLAFAVAINVDADILLIDEILAVGDANFQAKCFNKLREIKTSGKTIVLVTHDTGTVERFCDRAIWINDGKIVQIGDSRMVVDQYLNYMNEEKINSMEREEERRRAEEAKEKNDTNEALTATNDETNVKRYGTGTAELTKVILRDGRGKETLLLRADEPFSIDYYYRVKKKREELIFGMGIYTLEGVFVYGTNTMLAGIRVETQETGTLTFVCRNMPLLTGKYVLQVAICDINNTPVDFRREYCQFDVVSSSRDAGITQLDNEWILH